MNQNEVARDRYNEIVSILDVVCAAPREPNDKEAWNIVENIRTEARRRLDTISIKLTSMTPM
jgi:hypothetical protein